VIIYKKNKLLFIKASVWRQLQGDGNIRYFEVVDKAPYVYFLNQYSSDKPQRGLGM